MVRTNKYDLSIFHSLIPDIRCTLPENKFCQSINYILLELGD